MKEIEIIYSLRDIEDDGVAFLFTDLKEVLAEHNEYMETNYRTMEAFNLGEECYEIQKMKIFLN